MSTIVNESGLKPLGRAVLVRPYEPEIKNSVIVIPKSAADRQTMAESRVIVIEAGPSAWEDEPGPRAKPGDKVLVTKFAGYQAVGTADGVQYRLVNDRDIFCQIVEEEVL